MRALNSDYADSLLLEGNHYLLLLWAAYLSLDAKALEDLDNLMGEAIDLSIFGCDAVNAVQSYFIGKNSLGFDNFDIT